MRYSNKHFNKIRKYLGKLVRDSGKQTLKHLSKTLKTTIPYTLLYLIFYYTDTT